MLEFIPQKFLKPILRLGTENIEELRLRISSPALVKTNGKYLFLSPFGCSEKRGDGIVFTEKDSNELFSSLTEQSTYAFKEQIVKGYITRGGVRTGLTGRCVESSGKVGNLTDFTSYNIRIPHAIKGSADELFEFFSKGARNILLLSEPGAGKTTVLGDLAEHISSKLRKNVLIADERGEIFPLIKNKDFVDCISMCPKDYAFENGIRSMAPDVIVTDEIFGERDYLAVESAVRSGVNVIASAHSRGVESFFSFKENEKYLNLFDCFAVLENTGGKRKISVKRKDECGK